MPQFDTTPIPYVEIGTQAAAVRTAIDAARLSTANSFGGLQKLAIPGPFATDAEANTFGVPDDNLYYRSDGTVRAASHISLDLAFALDKTLTARTGPTPTFSRASSGLFVNANGILVGKTAGTTVSLDPTTTTVGTTQVTVTVASGSVVGWLVGQSVSLIVDSNANNAPDTGELWLVGNIVSMTATELVFTVTSASPTVGSATAWTLGYRGARFDHDPATGASKGLLIEESRTNLIATSVPGTNWTSGTGAHTVTQNSTDVGVAPDGSLPTKVVCTTSGNYQISFTAVTGTQYTASIYARVLSGTGPIRVGGIVAGAFSSGTATSQWARYSQTDISATTGQRFLQLSMVAGETIYLWGAQVEAGAFPTSYIPTTIGTAARSADVCSIVGTDFTSFYNQSGGTWVVDFILESNTSALQSLVDKNSFAVPIVYKSNGTIKAGLNQVFEISNPTPLALNTLYRVAFAYKAGDYGLSVNGSAVTTSNNAGNPALPTEIIFGSRGNLAINSPIARITYYRKRLSNAKLQTLTAP